MDIYTFIVALPINFETYRSRSGLLLRLTRSNLRPYCAGMRQAFNPFGIILRIADKDIQIQVVEITIDLSSSGVYRPFRSILLGKSHAQHVLAPRSACSILKFCPVAAKTRRSDY